MGQKSKEETNCLKPDLADITTGFNLNPRIQQCDYESE